MKITKALDWHVEGEIIDYNPPILEVGEEYVEKMKQDLVHEKELIKLRKEAKINQAKEKKSKMLGEI
jgi:hypothetical protein